MIIDSSIGNTIETRQGLDTMKNKKKWYILLGGIITLILITVFWGRTIFMYLFINFLLLCTSDEQCKKDYDLFLQDKSVYKFNQNVHPWQYNELKSTQTDLTHRFFSLPSTNKNARTIIFFHGFNTEAGSFLPFHPLSKQYNLISYYLPEDTKLYKGKFQDFIPILNDFFNHVQLDSVILLGNSIGGAVISHYALLQEEKRVNALILLASTNFGAVEKDIKRIRRMRNMLLQHEDYELFNLMQRGENILSLFREKNSSRKNLVKKKITWYRQILNSLYNSKGLPKNKDNTYPVIAIHGENDRLLPKSSLHAFDLAFTGVEYHLLTKGRHAIYNSHTQEIMKKIMDFLKKNNL